MPALTDRWNVVQRTTGFTLIEVLIVIVTLGIVATLGLPALNSSLEESRLSRATNEVVTALEFAQLTTMSSGIRTRVTIDTETDTILVEKFTNSSNLLGSETELSEGEVEGGSFAAMERPMDRGTDYNISLASDDGFSSVDIASSVFGADNFVIFDELGTPSDGGAVTLILGSQQVFVTVDQLTGMVTVSD
jgi:prepilin-type N-terminal cleavage/methylation domain-containing protein